MIHWKLTLSVSYGNFKKLIWHCPTPYIQVWNRQSRNAPGQVVKVLFWFLFGSIKRLKEGMRNALFGWNVAWSWLTSILVLFGYPQLILQLNIETISTFYSYKTYIFGFCNIKFLLTFCLTMYLPKWL